MEWLPPPHFRTQFYWEIVGEDREGCPIVALPIGVWDFRKAINAGEREDWLRYMDQLFSSLCERMRKNSKICGLEVTQFILIADYSKFSLRQLTSIGSTT
jgi:hypothetical protein